MVAGTSGPPRLAHWVGDDTIVLRPCGAGLQGMLCCFQDMWCLFTIVPLLSAVAAVA